MKKKVIVDLGGGAGERAIDLAKRNPDADVYVIDDFRLFKEYGPIFKKNVSLSGLSNVHLIERDFKDPKSYDFLKGRKISEVEMNFLHGGVPTIPMEVLQKMNKSSRITVRMDSSYEHIAEKPYNKHFNEEIEGLKKFGFRVVVKKSQSMSSSRKESVGHLRMPEKLVSRYDGIIRGWQNNYVTLLGARGKKPTVLENAMKRRMKK